MTRAQPNPTEKAKIRISHRLKRIIVGENRPPSRWGIGRMGLLQSVFLIFSVWWGAVVWRKIGGLVPHRSCKWDQIVPFTVYFCSLMPPNTGKNVRIFQKKFRNSLIFTPEPIDKNRF
jgi:hypothetical protein